MITVDHVPFDHAILDGYWDPMALIGCRDEMPTPTDPRWRRFDNAHERKLGGSDDMFGPATTRFFETLASEAFCAELQEAFQIGKPLTIGTLGGGYHCIPPGGYLGMHVDFNRAENGLYRRLNLLIYLNNGWDTTNGGELELGAPDDPDRKIVGPVFNRTVVFATSETSWHGHPKPTCGYLRRSLAAYYFSEEPPPNVGQPHDTIFQ